MKFSDFSDIDYAYIKNYIITQHDMFQDLQAMHGIKNDAVGILGKAISLQELEQLKETDEELIPDLEILFKEIIENEKLALIKSKEYSRDINQSIGDFESEYQSIPNTLYDQFGNVYTISRGYTQEMGQ